jgi:NADH-quinone oxidoreductase subunit K
MMMLTLHPGHYLALAATLFVIGAAGALLRRNALVVLMCIELMLNAANLAFLAYARALGSNHGHAIAFFIMAIAAAEASIGLAIVLGAFRTRQTVNLDEFDTLRDDV